MAFDSHLCALRTIVLFALACASAPATLTTGAEPESLAHSWQAIQREWQGRQEGIRSLTVEWTQERTDLKGALSPTLRFLKVDTFGHGDVPPEDTTYVNDCRLVIDGARSRYEYKGYAVSRQQKLDTEGLDG